MVRIKVLFLWMRMFHCGYNAYLRRTSRHVGGEFHPPTMETKLKEKIFYLPSLWLLKTLTLEGDKRRHKVT